MILAFSVFVLIFASTTVFSLDRQKKKNNPSISHARSRRPTNTQSITAVKVDRKKENVDASLT